jgi:hypothetical protein
VDSTAQKLPPCEEVVTPGEELLRVGYLSGGPPAFTGQVAAGYEPRSSPASPAAGR